MAERKIKYRGKQLAVPEGIYRAIKQPIWREKKRRQRAAEKQISEVSLDALMENGTQLADSMSVEDIVEAKDLLDLLHKALLELTDDERNLIDELFTQGKTERAVSIETSIPNPTIHKRKVAILQKLRGLLVDGKNYR